MGHIKMNGKNILTQKRHMPYTISIPYLEFAIFNSIVLVILYVIFVATEVHPDTIFSHNNNIKITNYTDYLPLTHRPTYPLTTDSPTHQPNIHRPTEKIERLDN